MIQQTIIALGMLASVNFSQFMGSGSAVLAEKQILASKELDLTNRLPDKYGNEVFSDNILLSLHYLKGDVEKFNKSSKIYGPYDIDWEKIRKPFEVSITLKKEEVFAFHANALPEYSNYTYSTNSQFITDEGYKTFAGLGGNGVCHIASLVNWASKSAGLEVVSKVNHDFFPINGISREYGTSIFSGSKEQNLYIKNGFDYPVKLIFKADSKKVILEITS